MWEYVLKQAAVQHTQEMESIASYTAHITEHLLPPLDVPAPLTERATLAASVNASLTPRFRFAEHSASAKAISLLPATADLGDVKGLTQIP